MSRNIIPTFVLLISRPPKHLEIPSWRFFNSPFHLDFKTTHSVIIWWNLDRDIDKILKGSHFENQHFMFITESTPWTLKIVQDYSGTLRSAHEHLWALMSTEKYCAKELWVVMAPWHQAHKFSLPPMSAVSAIVPCSWVLMAPYEWSWILMNAYEHPKCGAMAPHEH